MDKKTVRELRAIARELGLKGYSRLRKAELIKLITDNEDTFFTAGEGEDEDPVRPIREMIKK